MGTMQKKIKNIPVNLLFLRKLIGAPGHFRGKCSIMVRKITLLCLLFFGLHSGLKAQIVYDAVSIYMPFGTDTTCPGEQLTFIAVQSNDTFSGVQYHWYTDNIYTGVIIDTFYTTALVDSDSVYCWMVYHNSTGALDSSKSNTIIIRRSSSFPPNVIIALTTGRNPDCEGHPLTFTAYPVNGGSSPQYQWMINGLPLPGEDSVTITGYFSHGDTVTCMMISNSACSAPYPDTVFSNFIRVSHDSLTASISLATLHNPICLGFLDTFMVSTSTTGVGATLSWYVDSVLKPTVLGPTDTSSTLHDGDLVYVILNAPDPCIVNHTTVSNIITMTVITPIVTGAVTSITAGSNPGCIDSPVTITGYYTTFVSMPRFDWFVNGILTATGGTVYTNTFNNGDVVTFRVSAQDNGCYSSDTVFSPGILMVRDSTPVTPWLSLIGDLLVVNNGGAYRWYMNDVPSYSGTHLANLPTITGDIYNPHAQGYYFVIKDTNNCRSQPSNIIYIVLAGVRSVNPSDVQVFPNPTTGIVNLDWGTRIVNDVKMDVYNMMGQGLLHQDITNKSRHEADLSYLPEGSYLIVLRDEDGNKSTYKINIVK